MKNYFKHDFYARLDPKIKKLNRVHGIAGYGVYWFIIETLYEQGGYITAESVKDLAYDMRLDEVLIISILKDFGLFQFKKGKYFSDRVLVTLAEITDKSEKAKAAINARWKNEKEGVQQPNKIDDTDVLRTNNYCNTNEIQPSNERNTIREEKIIKEQEDSIEDKTIYAAAKLIQEKENISGAGARAINKDKFMTQVDYDNLYYIGDICYHESETLDIVIDNILLIASENQDFFNLINALTNKDIGKIRERFFSGGKGGKWTRRDITDPKQYITKILTEWKKQRGL